MLTFRHLRLKPSYVGLFRPTNNFDLPTGLTRKISQATLYTTTVKCPSLQKKKQFCLSNKALLNGQLDLHSSLRSQLFSTQPNPEERVKDEGSAVEQTQEHVGIFKRFKNAYKEYGKTLIAVHVATSTVWYGSFVYAARCGVDVIPWLEWMGAGETILTPFRSTGLGDFAVAYLMYKLATPARYTVTIGGTQATVKLLRRYGYMDPVPEGDSLRELLKESREQAKDRREELTEKFKYQMEEKRDEWRDRKDEIKDEWSDRKTELKDKFKDRKDELKDKFSSKASRNASSNKKL